MVFLLDPSLLTSASLSVGNLVGAHPELVRDLVEHVITHSVYSHIRSRRGPTLSRAERRKTANRRRRWFVDNIVMHHKRLHDKNRAIAIGNVRQRLLEKREALKKQSLTSMIDRPKTPDSATKWRDRYDGREKISAIKGRVDTRRARARSRWLSVVEVKNLAASSA